MLIENPYPKKPLPQPKKEKKTFLEKVSAVALGSFLVLLAPLVLGVVVSFGDSDPTAGQGAGWLFMIVAVFAGPVFVISLLLTIVAMFTSAVSDTVSRYKKKNEEETPAITPIAIPPAPEKSVKKTTHQITPLLGAILSKDISLVRTALTDDFENLNTAYAQNGNTPLHVAALNGYTDIVRLLLEQPGIDIGLTNNNGKTALDLARERDFIEIAQLIEGVPPRS